MGSFFCIFCLALKFVYDVPMVGRSFFSLSSDIAGCRVEQGAYVEDALGDGELRGVRIRRPVGHEIRCDSLAER